MSCVYAPSWNWRYWVVFLSNCTSREIHPQQPSCAWLLLYSTAPWTNNILLITCPFPKYRIFHVIENPNKTQLFTPVYSTLHFLTVAELVSNAIDLHVHSCVTCNLLLASTPLVNNPAQMNFWVQASHSNCHSSFIVAKRNLNSLLLPMSTLETDVSQHHWR